MSWNSTKNAPITRRTSFSPALYQDFITANGFDLWSYPAEQRNWRKFLLTGRPYPKLWTRNERPESQPPYSDHIRCFKNSKAGVVCFTSQPYNKPDNLLRLDVTNWATRRGLVAEVYSPAQSWYYPGSTCLIVIHSPDVEILLKPRAGE